MSRDDNINLQDQFLSHGLYFSGSITASVTHELNNVLGTIDQLSGLLEDLAFTVSNEGEIKEEQLRTISDRISVQTERGIKLIKRLNRFAHSSDETISNINIVEAIENIVALMQRLASMQKVKLVMTKPKEDIMVFTNQFILLEIIFLVIKKILPCTNPDTELEVIPSEQNKDVLIAIKSGHDGSLVKLSDGEYLRSAASRISGNIEEFIDEGNYNFELRIPMSRQ